MQHVLTNIVHARNEIVVERRPSCCWPQWWSRALAPITTGVGAERPRSTHGVEELRRCRGVTQAYGQALAARGAHITFADDVGATEVVFPG